ncbi:CBS domain-containing membrane protein [Desulfonauticus submarinus]|uniref:CBS domain-containing membrane protein n=1 Tax=Desulfonauticus submarinus TaxID=206665 RepID=A0A1H0GPE4_9BACT|nr:CBS domain-containing protein [Desulfonauticus submarinus]SDO08591.1 CBS domain-containing membrane protein [Desulfonauticus submarinus]
MLKVADLMSKDVFTLKFSDTIAHAKSLMNLARIRHIPIVDGKNNFVGLITHRDILAATISKLAEIDEKTQAELDASIPICEIMRKDITTVPPDMPLKEAAQILVNHKYGCLPVLKDNKLVGILTEADFLNLTISLLSALEQEISLGSTSPRHTR